MAVIAASIFGIQSCTAADHVSCADFVSSSSAQQLDAVHVWQNSNGGRPLGDMSDRADVSMLSSYCSQPSHSGDNLQDLQVGVGRGS
ncbi:hypothetical protein BA895_19845 [Humibacillus sp. DSM 29435]|nr:hypothetical protein BA895_19845 [Humibacillus sp. DSM 29435]